MTKEGTRFAKPSKKAQVCCFIFLGVILLLTIFMLVWNHSRNFSPKLFINTEKASQNYFAVSAKNFEDDIAAFDITIQFNPEEVEILGISKGDIKGELAVSRELYANTEGKITAMFVDYSGGEEPISINGDIFYVNYKLKKPVAASISFGNINIVNPEGTIKQDLIKEGASIEI